MMIFPARAPCIPAQDKMLNVPLTRGIEVGSRVAI